MSNFGRITQQIQAADGVLIAFSGLDPNAVVAGGAPRDWVHNRVATDIDVFLSYPDRKVNGSEFGNLLNRFLPDPFRWTELSGQSQDYESMSDDVLGVYESYQFGEVIQVIRTYSPASEAIKQFPVSLSQISYGWNGTVDVTNAFRKSFNEKVLFRTAEGRGNVDKYIRKIRDKFPEYRWIGETFEPFNQLEL